VPVFSATNVTGIFVPGSTCCVRFEFIHNPVVKSAGALEVHRNRFAFLYANFFLRKFEILSRNTKNFCLGINLE